MAKYGFSTSIPYDSGIYEVTGVEYCTWEDALEACNNDSIAIDWATYDILIHNGYFVSPPKSERPASETVKPLESRDRSPPKEEEKKKKKNKVSPGFRDSNEEDGFTLIEGNTREPVWTQSRILQERDKLLKERERIHLLKEKALEQKVLEQQLIEHYKGKQREKARIPISEGFWILLGVFFFMFFLGMITILL